MSEMTIVLSGEQRIGKTFIAKKLQAVLPEWMADFQWMADFPQPPLTIKIISTEVTFNFDTKAAREEIHVEAVVKIK